MKRLLRIAACCLALAFCLSGCSTLASLAQQLQNRTQPDAPLAEIPYIDPAISTSFPVCQSTFYYDRLTDDAERTVYRAALYHFASGDTGSFYLKGSYTQQQVAAALRAVQYDYPQLLCAPWGQKCSYFTTATGEALGIELYYSIAPDERAGARDALCAAVNEILAAAAVYDDPFDREVFLYETLISGTEYDYDAAAASGGAVLDDLTLEERTAHTAYGALVSRSTVCDGYAGAFQLLCNYAGIESATVIGRAKWNSASRTDSGELDNHAWNLVVLPDGTYYCDATWDDYDNTWLDPAGALISDPESTDGLRPVQRDVLHRYLNLSYEEVARNHLFGAGANYPTDCDGGYGYFVRTGRFFSEPEQLTEYALRLAQEEAFPPILCFELQLATGMGDVGQLLSRCFSGIAPYDYLVTASPANATGICFVCLYY